MHALNALAPPKRAAARCSSWSFFASWLTIELVWHHLAIGVAVTAALVAGGALDEAPGVVGLVLMVPALAILASIAWTTRRTVISMQGRARRSRARARGATVPSQPRACSRS